MASESIAKVLAAHITAKGKRTEALAAYFSERRPTGQKVVKEAFQDAPGDLRIFFLVFAIINALADVIAVERLVLDREDLAENLILAAFAGQALSTVRAAFKGLAPSTTRHAAPAPRSRRSWWHTFRHAPLRRGASPMLHGSGQSPSSRLLLRPLLSWSSAM